MVAYLPQPASACPSSTEPAVEIRVRGIVQGVGFRPMVYRFAQARELRGTVHNDGEGVVIRVAGQSSAIAQFIEQLTLEAPPLARITSIEQAAIAPASISQSTFEIVRSHQSRCGTQVSPDAAVCPQCLSDTLDFSSRFYRYPFTNCTHCGPRLSIVRSIPYDRAHTSMAAFPMCSACQADYTNPLNRRFHAQPIACNHCGPKVWLERADGLPITADKSSGLDDTDIVCALLQRGEIVAVKGIGGFHLACDATNEEAVQRLRDRKHRYHKPFALMVRDLSVIEPYCDISDAERALLESPAAPIVLLQRKPEATGNVPNSKFAHALIAPSVSPRLPTLGVMLPYTPLHHLMLREMERPIVFTSGNLSDEPQCINNDAARENLGDIATYFLLHDRAIVNRVDDSVVRVTARQNQILRRARGYAPAPIYLPPGFQHAPPILAMGSELKSTFCLSRNGEAMLSQHLGDLENAVAFEAYQSTLRRYCDLFEHEPAAIATDLHPDYLSTKLGQDLSQGQDLPLYRIQHHHAHIAACMVEHALPIDTAPVLGIVLDGLGYGDDGTFWGGEFLVADYRTFQRVAQFEPIAMLGGAQAVRQPWRNTYAQLANVFAWENLITQFGDLELVQFLTHQPRSLLEQMLKTGTRSPRASSAGRLFDAVAAAVGICREQASYEGQAAIEFEALISPNVRGDRPYPFAIRSGNDHPMLTAAPLWHPLLQDLRQGTDIALIAANFHQGLANAIAELAIALTHQQGCAQVVLSGGVFQNQVLLTIVQNQLHRAGMNVLIPHKVPPHDGGIALGQVAIAAARILTSP